MREKEAHDEAATLRWTPAFETGVEAMDISHRRLVELFNEVAEAASLGDVKKSLMLLSKFGEQAAAHFSRESAIMSPFGVSRDHRRYHESEHRNFLAFVAAARDLPAVDFMESVSEVTSLLAQWLSHHILVVDRSLARQLSGTVGDDEGAADEVVRTIAETNEAMATKTLDLVERRREIRRVQEESGRSSAKALRLQAFNRMLLGINQAMTRHEREDEFVDEACRLAVKYNEIHIAWAARVEGSEFYRVAAAGNADALAEIQVSIDPASPFGNGVMSEVWFNGVPEFCQDFDQDERLAPWRDWARAFGLRAVAVLPLYRGGEMWALLVVHHGRPNVFDADMRHVLNQIARDISRGLERIDLARRERQNKEVRDSLLANALAGIVMTRRATVVDANQHMANMLGYTDRSEMFGLNTRQMYADRDSFEKVAAMFPSVYGSGVAQASGISLRHRDGSVIVCDISGSHSGEMEDNLVVWTVVDVTLRERLRARVEHESLHDALTGLPDRRALEQAAPGLLVGGEPGRASAVCMIDLNDFKEVNDRHGHAAGDSVLSAFAGRVSNLLRKNDFIARLGGDEFVVIAGDIELDGVRERLEAIMARVHAAVESPFSIDGDTRVRIGMSIGVSLRPNGGADLEELLREADAAMYEAKSEKRGHHQRWWQIADAAAAALGIPRDVRTPQEREADDLRSLARHVGDLSGRFVDRFYEELDQRAFAAEMLAELSDGEMSRLRNAQVEHFRFLADPDVALDRICERARTIGEIHMLCGVGSTWMMRAHSIYRHLAAETLHAAGVTGEGARRMLNALDARLEADIEAQVIAAEDVLNRYFDALSRPLPKESTLWADVASEEMTWLGELPGVRAAVMMRLGTDGAFVVEAASGGRSSQISALLEEEDYRVRIGEGQRMVTSASAWISAAIETCPSFRGESQYAPWRERLTGMGARSSASVPVLDAHGNPAAVITLFGAYPNQFSSKLKEQFLEGLRRRWEQLFARRERQGESVSKAEATAYRSGLVTGGLRMLAQPVVDLGSGQVKSVEGLARLRLRNGDIVPPGRFLSLLSSTEMDRLFCLTLDRMLGHVNEWRRQGLDIGVSVNVSPATLMDAQCVSRVRSCLESHAIEPSRLTLEVLEGERLQHPRQENHMRDLRALGVSLAMDDLGSGYSSLKRLSEMPFDVIKIDKSLAMGLERNPMQNLTLIDTILRIGQDFGRKVIAEGLENDGIIEAFSILGASCGQGFGIARPMPPEHLAEWVERHHASLAAGERELRTPLGAIAYLWSVMHQRQQERAALRPDVVRKVGNFIAGLGERACHAYASDWLRAQREQDVIEPSQARMTMNWLMEMVTSEGGAGSLKP